MNSKTVGAILSAAVMLLTTLLFVLFGQAYFTKAVYWIAFVSVVCMEFAGGMLLLYAGKHPHRVAAAMGILLGAVLIGVLSVVYVMLVSQGIAFFVVFVAVVFAVAAIQALILWKHNGKDSKREGAREFFDSCRNVVAVLRSLPEGKTHSEALRLLEDDLRYADDTRFTEQDGQIKELLTQLSNGMQEPGYDPTAIIADLRSMLRQRQQMLHP